MQSASIVPFHPSRDMEEQGPGPKCRSVFRDPFDEEGIKRVSTMLGNVGHNSDLTCRSIARSMAGLLIQGDLPRPEIFSAEDDR